MHAHPPHDDHAVAVPPAALRAAGLLILVTLVAVATVRLSGLDIRARGDSPVLAERHLQFIDRPDGSLEVREADGRGVRQVPPGADNFMRGALRAMARERRAAGLGPEAPFRLAGHADGRLTLTDTATGRRLDLDSFGPDNAASFARLLDAAPAR